MPLNPYIVFGIHGILYLIFHDRKCAYSLVSTEIFSRVVSYTYFLVMMGAENSAMQSVEP